MAHTSQATHQAPASSTTSCDNTKAPRNAKWSTSDDTALVDTLKTFASGNSADNGTFKSVAFTAAAKALEHSHEASGGAPKTARNCSRRWATLKANCLIVQRLITASGFGWDEMTKMATAEESVWAKYLEAHPKAKPWHYNPFPLYDDILSLIEGRHATGEGALHIPDTGRSISLTPEAGESILWPSTDEEEENETPISSHRLKRERAASTSPDTPAPLLKKKRAKVTGPAAILGVADALAAVASSLNTPPEIQTLDTFGVFPPTPKRRMDAIAAISGDINLSTQERVKAISLFSKDIAKADAYLAVSDATIRSAYIQLELANAT